MLTSYANRLLKKLLHGKKKKTFDKSKPAKEQILSVVGTNVIPLERETGATIVLRGVLEMGCMLFPSFPDSS